MQFLYLNDRHSIRLKKFKHTNEELELAKLQSEKEKKKKESED